MANLKGCPSDYDLLSAWHENKRTIEKFGEEDKNFLSTGGYYDENDVWIREGTYYTWMTLPTVDKTEEQKMVTIRGLQDKLTDDDREKIDKWKKQKFYPKEKERA